MLAFVPREPTTYEDNEAEINKFQAKLEDALERRDYINAGKLQKKLDYCMNVRTYCEKQANQRDKSIELNRLETQRRQEEEKLKQTMTQRTEALLRQYKQRLEQMERRHAEELEQIDRKYSNPRYCTMRNSPEVNSLLRMEAFYAKQKNYAVAAAIKEQAAIRTESEMDVMDSNTDAEVQSKIDVMIKKHELEKKGFRDRLENEKMRLNRETANALLTMKNKYGKLRRRVLGLGENDPLPDSARQEGRGVYQTLEKTFSPMLAMIENTGVAPAPPLSQRTARAARNGNWSNDYFATRRSTQTSARNPRVQRALERSMTRKEAF